MVRLIYASIQAFFSNLVMCSLIELGCWNLLLDGQILARLGKHIMQKSKELLVDPLGEKPRAVCVLLSEQWQLVGTGIECTLLEEFD